MAKVIYPFIKKLDKELTASDVTNKEENINEEIGSEFDDCSEKRKKKDCGGNDQNHVVFPQTTKLKTLEIIGKNHKKLLQLDSSLEINLENMVRPESFEEKKNCADNVSMVVSSVISINLLLVFRKILPAKSGLMGHRKVNIMKS